LSVWCCLVLCWVRFRQYHAKRLVEKNVSEMSNFVSSETQNLNLYSCPNLLAYLLTSLHVGLYEMLMAMKSTRSSSLVTLACPSTSFFLRITDRFFQHASPRLWYQLPATLRQPRTNLPMSDLPIVL